jgi:branched-chain amino acid transport system substrate-binding protein
MTTASAISRRVMLAGSAGYLASPAIIGRAAAVTRGVTDTEIVIGTMTDLSGVTAVQGVNNANAMRLAFDEANERGGIHGRTIRWIAEDMEYIVPKAVQAMNKLLNRDNIFFAIGNGGTPHNDAVMPSMFEKNVPNVFPLTCARSMYEPFNRLKFGQFASYYDQMRAGVKYFVGQRGKKVVGLMYQDTDFGRDVHAGVVAQLQAMGLTLAAETAHRPTDTDFNAALARQHDAGCDLVCMGTIVRDPRLSSRPPARWAGMWISVASSPAIPRLWRKRRVSRRRDSIRWPRRSIATLTIRSRPCRPLRRNTASGSAST